MGFEPVLKPFVFKCFRRPLIPDAPITLVFSFSMKTKIEKLQFDSSFFSMIFQSCFISCTNKSLKNIY